MTLIKPPVRPAIPLCDRRFRYVPAACTDVQATWARAGWVPPTKERAHG